MPENEESGILVNFRPDQFEPDTGDLWLASGGHTETQGGIERDALTSLQGKLRRYRGIPSATLAEWRGKHVTFILGDDGRLTDGELMH